MLREPTEQEHLELQDAFRRYVLHLDRFKAGQQLCLHLMELLYTLGYNPQDTDELQRGALNTGLLVGVGRNNVDIERRFWNHCNKLGMPRIRAQEMI